MGDYSWIIAAYFVLLGGIIVYFIAKKIRMDNQIEGLANGTMEMTPEEFFQFRDFSFGGKGRPKYALHHDFEGIYILYNRTKNMYYVGQAKKIFERVNSHFSGRGNGDVYADYKYGDEFTIKMISFKDSGFDSLNALERAAISKYNAFARGYNKTRGNR